MNWQPENMNFEWINDIHSFQQRFSAQRQRAPKQALALDTEFVREKTYYPILALVQLGFDDGEILLIDAAIPEVAAALAEMLSDPNHLKIMHSASEDIQAFMRACNTVPVNLFDTQIAAAMSGFGPGLSYQNLILKLLDTHVEKGETRSDWLRRPLSDSQKQYAADDVRHLHRAHALLAEKLTLLGRNQWHTDDCQRLVESASDERIDRRRLHHGMRVDDWSLEAQARLVQLFYWRETNARSRDMPKRWLLENDAAVALARFPLQDRNDFESRLNRLERAPKRARSELFNLHCQPLSAEELDIEPAPTARDIDRKVIKQLQNAVAELAESENLPPGLLCSRKHLEALLETDRWPSALEGWREPLLREKLAGLLQATQQPPK